MAGIFLSSVVCGCREGLDTKQLLLCSSVLLRTACDRKNETCGETK